jgi:hypothetical protein
MSLFSSCLLHPFSPTLISSSLPLFLSSSQVLIENIGFLDVPSSAVMRELLTVFYLKFNPAKLDDGGESLERILGNGRG